MGLFSEEFIEKLKCQADIVLVIQGAVSLKKSGATYKGRCPFHDEQTSSFHVNREKGFFHCFGCGVGGDVIKFVELHDKISFAEATKALAQRFGVPLQGLEPINETTTSPERDVLLQVYEAAASYFRQQLASDSGAAIRKQISERVSKATSQALGLGYAPRDGLKRTLLEQGFSEQLLLRSGLVFARDDSSVVERFRNRLMIPICHESGSVIAFTGRSVDVDQQPTYLNSPDTPLYSKARTLYGLHLSKAAIRQSGFAILVDDYFEFAQLFESGFQSVIALRGAPLTRLQAQQLRRFTDKVVLSFGAETSNVVPVAKSSLDVLVAEGFEVNAVVLPAGDDSDTFLRKHGQSAFVKCLKNSTRLDKPTLLLGSLDLQRAEDFLESDHAAAATSGSSEGHGKQLAGSSVDGPRTQAILLNLPADLALDLDAFCRAHFDAPRVGVIREAIRTMIDAELASSPEFRHRFLKARKHLDRGLRPKGRETELERSGRDAAVGKPSNRKVASRPEPGGRRQ